MAAVQWPRSFATRSRHHPSVDSRLTLVGGATRNGDATLAGRAKTPERLERHAAKGHRASHKSSQKQRREIRCHSWVNVVARNRFDRAGGGLASIGEIGVYTHRRCRRRRSCSGHAFHTCVVDGPQVRREFALVRDEARLEAAPAHHSERVDFSSTGVRPHRRRELLPAHSPWPVAFAEWAKAGRRRLSRPHLWRFRTVPSRLGACQDRRDVCAARKARQGRLARLPTRVTTALPTTGRDARVATRSRCGQRRLELLHVTGLRRHRHPSAPGFLGSRRGALGFVHGHRHASGNEASRTVAWRKPMAAKFHRQAAARQRRYRISTSGWTVRTTRLASLP